MIKSIILDFDGTVIKPAFKMSQAKREFITKLSAEGFDVSGLQKESAQGILDSVKIQIRTKNMKADYDALRRSIYTAYEKVEEQAVRSVELQANVINTLEELAANKKLALVSSNGKKAVMKILENHSLLKFFKAVITRDDIESLKPHPDGILTAMKILNTKPEDTVYVGDDAIDVYASRNAGVKSVAVISGWSSLEDLKKASPDYIINSVSDLPQLINTINK